MREGEWAADPSGWPGIGLILLRLTVAVHAIICAIDALVRPSSHAIGAWAVGLLTISVGAAIVVGFLTPAASAAATVGYIMTGVSPSFMTAANHQISALAAFNLAAISAALVLLGPGALSFDVRLVGPREIVIPEGRIHQRR